MRRFGLSIASLALAASLASGQASNSLSIQESKEGWALLFDGKSLSGWEQHGNGDWQVANGSIVCGGTTPSWLGTTNVYSDYVLKLEFRGPAQVNSGVFLRSQKEGQPHLTGYELQIWDYQPAGFNTGSLVNSAKASPVKILGDQWNKYEITADGDRFVIVLNRENILDTKDTKHASGVIGFQCQKENRIEFRNIRIKPVKR